MNGDCVRRGVDWFGPRHSGTRGTHAESAAPRGIRGLVIRTRGGEVKPIGDRLVRADAAITINGLVRWTINRGYAGLEAWAGTPGTVGGAIYGNAHWKKINIGDLVESVRLVKPDGTLLQVPADRMEFEYDYSRLKRTGDSA